MESIKIHISDTKLNESTVILEIDDNASDAKIEKAASLKVADLINWYWDMEEVKQMIVDIFNTTNKYDIIYADPPWRQSKGGKKKVRPITSGTSLDYNVLSLAEIKEHLAIAT